MKKIASLFKRDYDGSRLVLDEIVPGSEWVLAGEGVATEKFDGTACMVRGGKLFKRYDRKPNKRTWKAHVKGEPWTAGEFNPAPDAWEACEEAPNLHTGHWPGWMPVGDGPEDKWFRDAWEKTEPLDDGTYELVGPKIGANPHRLDCHVFWKHGSKKLLDVPTSYHGLLRYLSGQEIEGIVWHHPDGRMVKIKRRDFGLDWPSPR